MIIIQISSDPYKRKISYAKISGGKAQDIDFSASDMPRSLRLLSTEYSECFFPFKAYEIVDLICDTYRTKSTPVRIRFRGTSEEYEELCAVCDILNSRDPKEEGLPPVEYERAGEGLANAAEILPKVKENFASIMDIINRALTSSANKRLIEEQREKFDDVSKTEIPICVIGNYSSGKSTFINALVGCEFLPSGDKPMTAKIYEIRCSEQPNVADVKFTLSSGDSVRVKIQGDIPAKPRLYPRAADISPEDIRPEEYRGELADKITRCLDEEKNSPLALRVQSLLGLLNDSDIDDRVQIRIPFNSDSPLCSREHPYVLFDTPGDNVANHERHIQVLQEALRGMSNGLMLYVTVSNQLHTMSNQQLCDKVKSIPEIDTRFTMVIVNQGDNADFTEYDRKEILDSPIPRTLQPEGIYYVSSVMALGAKTDGNFLKDSNTLIYMQKQAFFRMKPGERFAQMLFGYNIAPTQIETASAQGALRYSEFGDRERVLANSGLWVIEQEIQRFAENYAPYNKCYQSLQFLLRAKEIAQKDIAAAIQNHDKSRAEYQSRLDSGTRRLLDELMKIHNECVADAAARYPIVINEAKKKAQAEKISREDLVKFEEIFTEQVKREEESLQPPSSAVKAKSATFSVKNLLDAGARSQMVKDLTSNFKYWQTKNQEHELLRKKIGTAASDKLIEDVRDQFTRHVNRAQDALYRRSCEFWSEIEEKLKSDLTAAVMGSSELSAEKREELQELIEGFEQIEFTVEAEKIFEKEYFEKHIIPHLYEDYTLMKGKLAFYFNSELKDKIEEIADTLQEHHWQIFEAWEKLLFYGIENNITELNPELKDAKTQVSFYQDLIDTLQSAQRALDAAIRETNRLMDWKLLPGETAVV